MRAMVCSRFGGVDDLTWTEVPDPRPGPGTVLVDVEAAGVNFADLLMLAGRYQVKPSAPFVPGFEVSGRVAAVGAGVEQVAVGEPVMGFVWEGGYAEKVVVPATAVFPRPVTFGAVEGAAFLAGYGTAGHALFDRGRLHAGDLVVVLGASGSVGSAAVQLGVVSGAEVVAVTGSDGGERLARRFGAAGVVRRDRVCDLAEAVFAVTGGRRADLVVDPVGGAVSRRILDVLAPGGRLLVVGFAAGDIPHLPFDLVRSREVELVGVYWGALADRFPADNRRLITHLSALAAEGSIRPVVAATFPLPHARDALELVRRGDTAGRVVLTAG